VSTEHTAENDAHCCCGMHATVVGEVPDPGCPAHGERGINAWSTCSECGREWRHVVGHVCVTPPGEGGA
jgi:hypothetical protein